MSPRHPGIADPLVLLGSTVAAAALVGHQVAGKATRDALFLSQFDVRNLPAMMIASSLLAVVAVLALGRALALYSPARVLPVAIAAATALLVVEWGLSHLSTPLAAILVYLHMAVFGATLVSAFWSLVNERFDPYTAKRVVGRIGLGASVGGVLGGLLALSAARLVPLPAMLLGMAALNVLALVAIRRVTSGRARPAWDSTAAAHPLAGLSHLRATPYLRNLALLVASGALVEALLDYTLSSRAAARFPGDQELMGFFALFHTGVGVLGLVTQGVLARRSLEGLGLAGTVALQPAASVVGGALGVVLPGLSGAVLVRGSVGVLHHSLFRSAYELFYTPLPEDRKRAAKALVDVGFDKLGAVAGGAVAFLAVAFAGNTAVPTLFGVAAFVGLWGLLVARRLNAGYVAELASSLRTGAIRLEMPEVVDSTTRYTLARATSTLERETLLRQIEALRAGRVTAAPEPEPAEDPLLEAIRELRSSDLSLVRRALARHEPLDPALAPYVIHCLGRNELFLEALRALRRAAPRVTGQLVDALLDPEQPEVVRRRLPRVLKACPTPRAVEGLVHGLGDARLAVRSECSAALLRLCERDPALRPGRDAVFAHVGRELAAWAEDERERDSDRHLDHVFTLLALVLERQPLRIAQWALHTDDPLRGTALEYLENVLPAGLHERLFGVLHASSAARGSRRPHTELRDELVRSGDSLTLSRSWLRRRLSRKRSGSDDS